MMTKSLLVLALSLFANGEAPLPKTGEFDVAEVGRARVKFEAVGEPISQPERIEIFVTCSRAKRSKRVALYRTCKYEGYSYEPGTKTLSVTMYYGRVDPKTGDVTCDQFDIQHAELKDVCR